MKYNGVVIEITEVCPLHCAHCCQECGEPKKEIKSLNYNEIIQKLSEDRELNYVSLTGGEPFLNCDKMYDAIISARTCNMRCGVVTSGFWADNEEKVENLIKKLKELSLDSLTVSRDEFHRTEVSDENIKRILKWGRVYDLEVCLQISALTDTDYGMILNPLREELRNTRIETYPVFYAGRARKKISRDKLLCNEAVEHQFCGKGGAYLIDVKGDVYPCCSPLGKQPFFRLGNIKNDSAIQIRENLRKNGILHLLRNYGFDPFLKFAREKLQLEIPEKVVSACDLCALLFQEKTLLAIGANFNQITQMVKE